MSRKDLRLELRARNNTLWHVIFDLHASVAEFCRIHKFSQGQIGAWLNLSLTPYGLNGLFQPAQRLCELSGLSADVLFPPALYAASFQRTAVAEVDSVKYTSLTAARRLAIEAPNPEEAVMDADFTTALDECLASLTPREERMIRMYYGLADDLDEEQSFRQLGDAFSVTHERARQILHKGLRKLRHPKRTRRLKAATDLSRYIGRTP